MKKNNSLYRTHLLTMLSSLKAALGLAWKHFWQARFRKSIKSIDDKSFFHDQHGVVTTLYPYEAIPVPDHGRYRLHNEMDDCIVCDLCAKICPVNCIEIDPIKSTVEIGKTSDGSTRRIYAATFDIDMAKCCYCGLCTTVCPTESLTMTKAYDYSEYDVRNMVYQFADLSTEEAKAKRKEWDDAQAEKLKAKEVKADVIKTEDQTETSSNTTQAAPVKKVFIPKIPVAKKTTEEPNQNIEEVKAPELGATELQTENDKPKEEVKKAVPPKIKIAIPKKIIKNDDETNESNQTES